MNRKVFSSYWGGGVTPICSMTHWGRATKIRSWNIKEGDEVLEVGKQTKSFDFPLLYFMFLSFKLPSPQCFILLLKLSFKSILFLSSPFSFFLPLLVSLSLLLFFFSFIFFFLLHMVHNWPKELLIWLSLWASGAVNYDYIVTNGSRCIPNGTHTYHFWANFSYASLVKHQH